MDNVIYMAEHKQGITVPPKSEARQYKGQRFTLLFKPTAPVLERWAWHVRFTRTYDFVGSEPTLEKAAKAAQKQIDSMEGRQSRAII